MSLVADYFSSDESSASDSSESENEKLPLPSFGSKTNETSTLAEMQKRRLSKNSVYTNPYLHAEKESLDKLSKHTPLTKSKEETEKEKKFKKKFKKKEKTKLCLHFFKKGTCKYGDDCKFLHSLPKNEIETDSNLLNTVCNSDKTCAPSLVKQASVSTVLKKRSGKITNICYMEQSSNVKERPVDDTDDVLWEGGNLKRKKRVGLTDNLVPSKKAMVAYEKYSKT